MVPVTDISTATQPESVCTFRGDDVLVLLGAGASVDAHLLASMDMTKELENNLTSADPKISKKWGKYKDLYKAVKSSILYGNHLTSESVSESKNTINIEEFVNVLNELAKAESHTIYPFIAAWNMELVRYAGVDFQALKDFRRDIVHELVGSWVNVKNNEDCAYYRSLYRYWEETHYNLRVFSLNYDMCVERACGMDNICRGFRHAQFKDGKMRKVWADGNMDDESAEKSPIRLYKLHGSLDWRRDAATRDLYCEDSPDPCNEVDDYQLIFGTTYKLSYQDPFLFQISELRKHAKEARLIIAIGYSFNDDHINEILGQAMSHKDDCTIVSVEYLKPVESNSENERKREIATMLKMKMDEESLERIRVDFRGARTFFENTFGRQYVESILSEKRKEPF